MLSQKDYDKIYERTWYLPDQWWNRESPNDLEEWRSLLKMRNASRWDKSGLGEWWKFPHIFLVNRPLTFGQSQLVIPIPSNLQTEKESILFECASILIKLAIKGFEKVFDMNVKDIKAEFPDLANRTLSYGIYEKTIIMRVSADEDKSREYKVHLVPYFQSNASLCQERYCSLQKVSQDKKGGANWLAG